MKVRLNRMSQKRRFRGGGGPFLSEEPLYRCVGLGRGSDPSCSEIREEPNTSGGKTCWTSAEGIEGLCFRRGAVFQRGRPLNRLWRAGEGDGEATARRTKTKQRKSNLKGNTSILTLGYVSISTTSTQKYAKTG